MKPVYKIKRSILEKNSFLLLTEITESERASSEKQFEIVRYMGRGASAIAYLARIKDNNNQEVIIKELFPATLNEYLTREEVNGYFTTHLKQSPQNIELSWDDYKKNFIISKDDQIEAQRGSESGNNQVSLWKDKEGDGLYIVMSFDGGMTLDSAVADMSVSEILSVCAETAFYLSEFHRKKVLHMDVKAENILVSSKSPRHVLRILDFNSLVPFIPGENQKGQEDPFAPCPQMNINKIQNKYGGVISHTHEYSDAALNLTIQHLQFGENIEGYDVGPQTDIYALGLMLWKCLIEKSNGDSDREDFWYRRKRFPQVAFPKLKPRFKEGLSADSPRWIDLCNLLYSMTEDQICDKNCTECKGNNGSVRCRNTIKIYEALKNMSLRFRDDSFDRQLDDARAAVRKRAQKGMECLIQDKSFDPELLTRYQKDGEVKRLDEILSFPELPKLVLCTGESGAGKSVSAEYCAEELIRTETENQIRLPVYLSLDTVYEHSRFKTQNILLEELQTIFWGGNSRDTGRGTDVITKFMDQIQEQVCEKVCLYLFWDGFNEIKNESIRKKALEDLGELKKYSFVRVIISNRTDIPDIKADCTYSESGINQELVHSRVLEKGYSKEQADIITPVLRTPLLLKLFLQLRYNPEDGVKNINEATIMARYFDNVIVKNIDKCLTKDEKLPMNTEAKKILDKVIIPLVYQVESEGRMIFSKNSLSRKLKESGVEFSADDIVLSSGIFETIGTYYLKLVHQSYQEFLWAYWVKKQIDSSESSGVRRYAQLHWAISESSEEDKRYLVLLFADDKKQKLNQIMKSRIFPANAGISSFYKQCTGKKSLPVSPRQWVVSALLLLFAATAVFLVYWSLMPNLDTVYAVVPWTDDTINIGLYDSGSSGRSMFQAPKPEDIIINNDPDIKVYSCEKIFDENGLNTDIYNIITEDLCGKPISVSINSPWRTKKSNLYISDTYSWAYYNIYVTALLNDNPVSYDYVGFTRDYSLYIETDTEHKIQEIENLADYLVPINGLANMNIQLKEKGEQAWMYHITIDMLNHPAHELPEVYGYPGRALMTEEHHETGYVSYPSRNETINMSQKYQSEDLEFLLKKGAIRIQSKNGDTIDSQDELLVFKNTKVRVREEEN